MEPASPQTILFKRSHFATRLPADALFSPSHYWLRREADGVWRVGFSKFAVRMLGDLVDQAFEVPEGSPIQPGKIIGWIEGFKAISDIYCVVDGTFQGGNPGLKGKLELVNDAPYDAGWLYRATGEPDKNCMTASEYINLLNATIDRMLAQQKDADSPATP
ncbi:MAG TPA: glycine cleavage system protein H [Opitutaceae bacterium]